MGKEKRGKGMDVIIKRPCTPAESLKESLQQMKDMRKGKIPKKTWEDYLREKKE